MTIWYHPCHAHNSKPIACISKPTPLLDASISQISSADASWLYKIAEDFYCWSCDDLNLLFKKMFPNSGIAE